MSSEAPEAGLSRGTAGPGDSLDALVEGRHILVCCGSGGVGKTTAAAALALEGARRGRDAVVVTIDPARRLASALGLDELSNVARLIPRPLWDPLGRAPGSGRLSALMLDTKSTFDHLVTKYSQSPEQGEGILSNHFYRNVAGALSGTQEYMAMEKLHELHEDGGYELIVVDTPPSRNALDFLDAPHRLTRLLENRVFRLIMIPTRLSFRVANFAMQTFLRSVAKVLGSEVVEDLVHFFQAFEGMEDGFRQRARKVVELLASPDTAFVLVTSPRRDALGEARHFASKLNSRGFSAEALVINRVHPRHGDLQPSELRRLANEVAGDLLDGGGIGARRLEALYSNLADLNSLADEERAHASGLVEQLGAAPVAFVPILDSDVCDFASLGEVGRHLFSPLPLPSSSAVSSSDDR